MIHTVPRFALKAAPDDEGRFEGYAAAFDAYDQATAARLDKIETEFKQLTGAINTQLARLRRPPLAGGDAGGEVKTTDPAERKAWNLYFRTGNQGGLDTKAMSADVAPDGGFTVHPEMADTVIRAMPAESPLRGIANVIATSSTSVVFLVDGAGAASGWVGETQARPETDSPKLHEIEIVLREIYAMPKATQKLLDDSSIDIENWIASRVAEEFAKQERAAFVTGDGVARPRGFLTYDTVAQASWSFGKLGFTVTSAAGGFAASNPSDALVDLFYALPAGYRANAAWTMNSATAATVSKFKDGQGLYIWRESFAAGQPPTLLGRPVVILEDMPAVGAGAFPIAFGDFKRGYTIVDRQGIRVLRDPYSAKPNVLFYTTKRVGGGVLDFDAIKLLKVSA